MRRFLALALGGVALLATLLPTFGQVNTVPQPGVTSGFIQKATYSAAFFGLVPVVTAATDQVCISGSATKTIKVQRITIWGTTATAVQTLPVNLLRRASLDTGGTAGTTTANPANTIAKRDTNSATATAVLVSYTAAPTVNDSSPTYLDSQAMTMPIVTSVLTPQPVDFNFGTDDGNLLQEVVLRGVAQQICVNNGSALTNASAWNGVIVWTEE